MVSIATAALTVAILIFGEITPKNYATLNAEKITLRYIPVLSFFMTIMTPFIFIINLFSRIFMKLLRVDPDAVNKAMTEEEKTILLTRHDGLLQRQEGRIKELERRQDDLDKMASCVAMLAQRQEGMDSDIKEIKKDVSQMAQRSGRRWDMIVEKAIAAIAGALVGFILLKLGLG